MNKLKFIEWCAHVQTCQGNMRQEKTEDSLSRNRETSSLGNVKTIITKETQVSTCAFLYVTVSLPMWPQFASKILLPKFCEPHISSIIGKSSASKVSIKPYIRGKRYDLSIHSKPKLNTTITFKKSFIEEYL